MNLSRRSFLRGALAVTAVAVTNLPALASVPKIVGDGIHDDTDGLQALFDGKPFMVENETIIARSGYLRGGKFLLSRALEITGDGFHIDGGHFIQSTPGEYIIRFNGATNTKIRLDTYFEIPPMEKAD